MSLVRRAPIVDGEGEQNESYFEFDAPLQSFL